MRVMIVALSPATIPAPTLLSNKNEFLVSFVLISLTYAPPVVNDLYLIFDSASTSILYCAPATATAALSLFLTYALTVTVSPG